jgi:pimeloyl-ACP methyl ester carboxylesterase
MSTVTSKDGTVIAYETKGDGPPLLLVDGALCSRSMGGMSKLANRLAESFTVYTYDRRGRGESGDSPEYTVEREVEDIHALVAAAGGSVGLYGISSGAMLALEATRSCPGVGRLALYEAPLIVDDSRDPLPPDYLQTMEGHLAAGRRGAAVEQFLRFVGMPGFFLAVMKRTPIWRKLKALAHTLPYDARIVADYQRGVPLPADRWAEVAVPTLVLDGGKSPAWMRNGNRALAGVIPAAEHGTVDGQTHMVKAKALAPVLDEFFGDGEKRVAAERLAVGTA